jgi:hypothetical protein
MDTVGRAFETRQTRWVEGSCEAIERFVVENNFESKKNRPKDVSYDELCGKIFSITTLVSVRQTERRVSFLWAFFLLSLSSL